MKQQTMRLESEAGFRALFQYATVGILVIGKNGNIELANPCIESLFDYSVAELIGHPIEKLIPHSFRDKHVEHREKYFTRPKARAMGYGLNLFARKKDGVEFPVEISLAHYKLNDEDLAVAFVTDISERKKAEENLLHSKNKLDKDADALKDLNEAGNRLLHIEKLQDGLEEILKTSIELTGADKGNIQLYDGESKSLHIVVQKGFEPPFLLHFREVKADSTSACGKALKEGRQVIVADTLEEWSGEDYIIAAQSGFKGVQSTPLVARDGSPIGMISTHFKDAGYPDKNMLQRIELYARNAQGFIERVRILETIQKQNADLEDKVNERTKELITLLEGEKELNDLKSRFITIASHEFRTPLSTILSSMSLIESYSSDGQIDKRQRHIDRVKQGVKNLVGILDEFLSVEKIEQGKVEIIHQTFDLYEFTKEIIEEISGILRQGQQVKFSYNGKKEITQGKKILRNILLNLLSNASKYSKEDKEIHISVNAGDEIEMMIRDNGIGIPEEDQGKLFTKFFRARNATSIQGTGLGLNIVKKYLELIDGTISFTSEHDKGTTFILHFPYGIDNS